MTRHRVLLIDAHDHVRFDLRRVLGGKATPSRKPMTVWTACVNGVVSRWLDAASGTRITLLWWGTSEERAEGEEVMPYRIGVRPSKPVSLLGMIVGGLLVVLGIVLVMPNFGICGLTWTALAGAITVYHGYDFFSTRGISTYEVYIEPKQSDSTLR
jgi:hypothetical protein